VQKFASVDGRRFHVVWSALLVMKIVVEYLVCASHFPALAKTVQYCPNTVLAFVLGCLSKERVRYANPQNRGSFYFENTNCLRYVNPYITG
jgi:hypothetical protein